MQQNELSKISPVSLVVLAVVVFVSSTVSIFVNRLFNNADILADDHSTLANIVKTVDSIIETVDGKVDEKRYTADTEQIKKDIEEMKKNNQEMRLDIKTLLSRKQVFLDSAILNNQ